METLRKEGGGGIPEGGNGENKALEAGMFLTHQGRGNKCVGQILRLRMCLLRQSAEGNCSLALEAAGMKAFPCTEKVPRSQAGRCSSCPMEVWVVTSPHPHTQANLSLPVPATRVSSWAAFRGLRGAWLLLWMPSHRRLTSLLASFRTSRKSSPKGKGFPEGTDDPETWPKHTSALVQPSS